MLCQILLTFIRSVHKVDVKATGQTIWNTYPLFMVTGAGGRKDTRYIEILFRKLLRDLHRLKMAMSRDGNNMHVRSFLGSFDDPRTTDLKAGDKFIVSIRINCHCSIIADFGICRTLPVSTETGSEKRRLCTMRKDLDKANILFVYVAGARRIPVEWVIAVIYAWRGQDKCCVGALGGLETKIFIGSTSPVAPCVGFRKRINWSTACNTGIKFERLNFWWYFEVA